MVALPYPPMGSPAPHKPARAHPPRRSRTQPPLPAPPTPTPPRRIVPPEPNPKHLTSSQSPPATQPTILTRHKPLRNQYILQ